MNKKQIPSQSMNPEEYISYLHKLGSVSKCKQKVYIVTNLCGGYPVHVCDTEDKAKKWIKENTQEWVYDYTYDEWEVN